MRWSLLNLFLCVWHTITAAFPGGCLFCKSNNDCICKYSNRAGQVFRVAHVQVRGQFAGPGSHLPSCRSRLSKGHPAWQQASLLPAISINLSLCNLCLYLHCIINLRMVFVSFLFVFSTNHRELLIQECDQRQYFSNDSLSGVPEFMCYCFFRSQFSVHFLSRFQTHEFKEASL